MTRSQARLALDIFTVAMIASIAIALAGLTWRLLGHDGQDPVVLPASGSASQTDDLGAILALAPFGIPVDEPELAGTATGATLKAIFASTAPGASVALIAGADGTVAEYRVGETTPAGTIEEIAIEHVVLRSGNERRILGFDPDAAETVAAANARSAPAASAASTTSTPPAQPAPAPASGVDSIRALIPESQRGGTPPPPPPQPSRAPPIGYNVGDSPSPLLRAAGLRPGDVVRRLNGQRVDAASDPNRLLAGARGAGSARVEVLRNGKTVFLTVPTR